MAANLSGLYTFQNTNMDQIIADAFERIGVLTDLVTAQSVLTATRSLNFILSQWINKGFNQWTLTQSILNLVPGQSAYVLPIPTSDILEATIRTSVRQLGGTPFSSAGGVAANAFDSNPATACTQVAPNGFISYDYGAGNQVAVLMVGVTSFATLTYTLVFEWSNDNINWFLAQTTTATQYIVGLNQWIAMVTPVPARYFRVRETGGATLNINELYFNNTILDIPITRISSFEYVSMPQKYQQARPTSYWVDRQINPVVYLWPCPSFMYNAMYYTRVRMLQDVGMLLNTGELPSRFFEPLTAGLAVELAEKPIAGKPELSPEKIARLIQRYDEAFSAAAREDSEKTPLRIYGDYLSGWGQM